MEPLAIFPCRSARAGSSQEVAQWSPVVLRFFDYLTAVPVDRAFRTLALWTPSMPFEDFAATMVANIPQNWFADTHYAPTGPRLVFTNNRLYFERFPNPNEQRRVLPFHAFANPREEILPSPEPPRRRALNSFMAFRSYFSGIFPGIRQSVKSSLLSEIWTDDPLKSHWSLLARAYTLIRDNFRMEDPTLPLFIRLVASFMGMPTPRNYLALCGFTVVERDDPEHRYTISGPDYYQRIVPHVRTITTNEIVEFLLAHPDYQMEQYESSIWPFVNHDGENGQMAVAIDPTAPEIDDPLEFLFTGRSWDLDIEDTYSVVDDSIDPNRDLLYWPTMDLATISHNADERACMSFAYRSRRNAGGIPGVPPIGQGQI